ncbi:hypothetical protein HDU87_000961 [Geranomyces variabilis]|uniref:G-patch domain-containing protein n=1 Tax=Geranomyces variabilis TaxID=109894 RepID=A0AAD5TCX1_9FUNG|nr:hypothetical protein HDU87_000961 [Geranomyces variabilis]
MAAATNHDDSDQLFFVDTRGDSSLASLEPSATASLSSTPIVSLSISSATIAASRQSHSPRAPPLHHAALALSPAAVPVIPQDEFISISARKNKQKSPQRGRGRGRGGRRDRGHRPPRPRKGDDKTEEEIDQEEMALALDYIQNASVGDLSVLGSSLSALDFWDGAGSDPDEGCDAEVGAFESLMMGLDDEHYGSDSSGRPGSDSDSDDGSSSSIASAALAESSGDDDDMERAEQRYLQADFMGGRSAWDEGSKRASRATSADRRIQQTLSADFSTLVLRRSRAPTAHRAGDEHDPWPADLSSEDDDEAGTKLPLPLSRTQRRKADKRERAQQRSQRDAQRLSRDASARALDGVLSRSKGPKIDPQLTSFLIAVNRQMRTFVQNLNSERTDSITLVAMPSGVRKLVKAMAVRYHLLLRTNGKGRHKVTVLIRTQRSEVPQNWNKIVEAVVADNGGKVSGNMRSAASFDLGPGGRKTPRKKPGAPDQAAKPALGSIVGHGSAPVGQGNVGFSMLKKMGWTEGQSLGAAGSGAGVLPVEVLIRGKRTGLGA